MMTKKGKPKKSELPSTVARSGKKARRTFAKAHDSAAKEYGRVSARCALPGRRSSTPTRRSATTGSVRTKGPVRRAGQGRQEHQPQDRRWRGCQRDQKAPVRGRQDLDIDGRSKMSKKELVKAIQKENDKRTRKARG